MMHNLRAMALGAGALLVSVFGLTQVAQAGTISFDSDYTAATGFSAHAAGGNDFYNDGGEFRVDTFTPAGGLAGNNVASSGVTGSIFQTFCLELNEDAATSGFWNGFATSAVNGGVGGGNPDPLGNATAYLYTAFWNGNLNSGGGFSADYSYTLGSTRMGSARALQLAIWFLEQELTVSNGSQVATISALNNINSTAAKWARDALNAVSGASIATGNAGLSDTSNLSTALARSDNIGGARVINITLDVAGVIQRQSVLTLVLVPLPSAAWLGLGLMGALGAVGVIRRRKRQALA